MDLTTLVEGMADMLRNLLEDHVQIVTDYRASVVPVKVDQGQLEQVILNLVVNAVDALPSGGRITLTIDRVESSEGSCPPLARSGAFARLSVSDNGAGMHREVLNHIFDPFFTTKEGRTGLGLSVVYGIISQHRGWIEAQSEVDRGKNPARGG
jgi:two-component system cell cycle sensor histidine kinase/response regulator CckA